MFQFKKALSGIHKVKNKTYAQKCIKYKTNNITL